MFSSVAHKTYVEAESVEYPVDDGSRCAVSTGELHASGCTVSPVSAGGFPLTEFPFRLRPGCELQLVKAYIS